jgi:hypothetical protein
VNANHRIEQHPTMTIKEASTEAIEEPPKSVQFEKKIKKKKNSSMILKSLPTRVTPKPLPAEISVADIGFGDCIVQLERRKDLQSPNRVERAQRICRLLNERLKELFPATASNKPKVVIHARVVLASEGSRAGRFWAAEFGVGYAKLGVRWVLASSSSTDSETYFLGNADYKTNSAGCGIADLCQNNAGDQALDNMTDNVADDIFRKVQAHANQQ